MSSSSSSLVATRVADQVNNARLFFNTGRTRSYEWRKTQLSGLRKLLAENEGAIGEALYKDLHKPIPELVFPEVVVPQMEMADLVENLKEWMSPQYVPTPLALLPATSYRLAEPYGVVLVIGPFNFPVQLTLMPIAAAFAAGNAVVLKPSELTPATTQLLINLLPRYVDPLGLTIVPGAVEETTALLQQRFDYVFFTGSEMVGKIVARACAEYLTPVTLELGGKSPTIIHRDADLTLAARRVSWGKFFNAGQACIAPDYVYVHEEVRDRFVNECKKMILHFYGKNPKDSPDLGRIISERHVRRLESILNSHREDIVLGGAVDIKDKYVEPTLLQLAKPNGKAMEDEIFGPILPIIPYSRTEEVLEYINSHPKPLALYIFSSSSSFQDSIISRTSSGGVSVNDTMMHFSNPALPFGGVGQSGMGAYHGKASFELFSHYKSILNKGVLGDAPIRYPPYTKTGFQIFRFLASIRRVNSASLARFFKFLAVPLAVIAAAKYYGVTIQLSK